VAWKFVRCPSRGDHSGLGRGSKPECSPWDANRTRCAPASKSRLGFRAFLTGTVLLSKEVTSYVEGRRSKTDGDSSPREGAAGADPPPSATVLSRSRGYEARSSARPGSRLSRTPVH